MNGMRIAMLLAAAAGAASLAGCSQQAAKADPAQKAAVADQIRALEAGWNKDYANRDLNRAVGHYSGDGALMPAGMDRLDGPKAIRAGLEPLVKDPNFQISFRADRVEVAGSGDLAYTRGSYRMTMTDPKTKQPRVETGNYITTYKKQADGSWKAVDDMSTPGAPPAPAATPGA